MAILSDATRGRYAPLWQVRAAAGGGQSEDRVSVWLVSVTGVDGVTHEVLADELRVSHECWDVLALCGARVVPAALVVEPGRRCGGCAACPVDGPGAATPRRRRFGRLGSPRRRLNIRRWYAAAGGFAPQVVTG